MITHSYKR